MNEFVILQSESDTIEYIKYEQLLIKQQWHLIANQWEILAKEANVVRRINNASIAISLCNLSLAGYWIWNLFIK